MIDEKVKNAIFRNALKNAFDYGSAKEGAVISKVLFEFPALRSSMAELKAEVSKAISLVNGMDRARLEDEYGSYKAGFDEAERKKAEESKPKFIADGATVGNFKTRFPPAPNGYMHIGHAKIAFLEQRLAEEYKGRLVLYFDDTDPENERQEFVDAFKRDLDWLGIRFDGEYYASDNVDKMYGYAAAAIRSGNAYVCTCSREKMKDGRMNSKECEHRSNSAERNAELWNAMLDGSLEESAVLRLKGDMKSLNTVMRDPTLFRIKSQAHYRQGSRYTVWPTYDFNTPIMDSIMGITDTLRSKEYELRDELYFRILDMLGLRKPRIHSVARLEIKGNITSKRKLNAMVKEGLISGYDDPRLVTIAGLRNRGIEAAAIKEFALRFGMSKAESVMDIEMLLSYNRKLIDRQAKRLFAVEDPVDVSVEGFERRKVRLRLHPSEDIGYREYELGGRFLIDKADASSLKEGDSIRLKEAVSAKVLSVSRGTVRCAEKEGGPDGSSKALQWVDADAALRCRFIMLGNLVDDSEGFNKNSIEEHEGYVEGYAARLEDGERVQLERKGFFRLRKGQVLSFTSL